MHSLLPKTWQNASYLWRRFQNNWLPVDQRVQQNLNVTVFKYINKTCPYYMKEVFEYASQGRISSRDNYTKLKVSFRKTTMWQKGLSLIVIHYITFILLLLLLSLILSLELSRFCIYLFDHCLYNYNFLYG